MPAERQKQLLAGLLALIAGVGLWRALGADSGGVPSTATVAARRAVSMEVPPPPADVALDVLGGARLGPDDGGRNPFVFGARQLSTDDAGARRPVTRREVQPVTVPALPPGPPPLPPIPFKFIGLVEGTGGTRKIAVLSDSKGLVAHGSEGTIIDGRFRILSIGTDAIDIAYADGRGRQTLRLTGQ